MIFEQSIGIWESTHGSDGRCTMRLLETLRGHSAGVVRMCFTSAGDRLLSSSVDGSVSMWEISSDLPTTTTLTKYPTFDEYSVSISKANAVPQNVVCNYR